MNRRDFLKRVSGLIAAGAVATLTETPKPENEAPIEEKAGKLWFEVDKSWGNNWAKEFYLDYWDSAT